jgi:hypothetical protein
MYIDNIVYNINMQVRTNTRDAYQDAQGGLDGHTLDTSYHARGENNSVAHLSILVERREELNTQSMEVDSVKRLTGYLVSWSQI